MTAHEKPRVQLPASARLAMPLPELTPLRLADLWHALRAGLADFLRAPEYGLAVAGGCLALTLGLHLAGAGPVVWGLAAVLAVPLLAPFLLTGFYDISARRHAGETHPHLGEILHHLDHARHGQAGWAGLCLTLLACLWGAVAFGLWQVTGGSGFGLALQALWAVPAVGTLYGMAAMALPMLHDCRLDALTALLHANACVRDNRIVMMLWSVITVLALVAAVRLWFVGLVVVLPVLAHAQWHLYRRATLT